jgi:predicted nucleic acid-binding protein
MGVTFSSLGSTVYLDTNIFIYALEGYQSCAAQIESIFNAIDNGSIASVTSELTLAEVLVKPYQLGDAKLIDSYHAILSPSDSLAVLPISRNILIQAAQLRAANSEIRLPDAIHAATALSSGCDSFISNDKGLRKLSALRVVLLEEIQ